MVLVPFIYHTPSLIYDFSKLMHVWLTSLSMFKIALTFWFSLTAFHLSKWDEIWHAYHAVGCDWSWFIWWFLEMFKIAFELSLAVDFYELLFAMSWPKLFMMMMIDMNVNPIGFVSWLFEHDFGCLPFAVLTFSFSFDPRLALVVLLLTFELMFSGWPTNDQWDQFFLIELA